MSEYHSNDLPKLIQSEQDLRFIINNFTDEYVMKANAPCMFIAMCLAGMAQISGFTEILNIMYEKKTLSESYIYYCKKFMKLENGTFQMKMLTKIYPFSNYRWRTYQINSSFDRSKKVEYYVYREEFNFARSNIVTTFFFHCRGHIEYYYATDGFIYNEYRAYGKKNIRYLFQMSRLFENLECMSTVLNSVLYTGLYDKSCEINESISHFTFLDLYEKYLSKLCDMTEQSLKYIKNKNIYSSAKTFYPSQSDHEFSLQQHTREIFAFDQISLHKCKLMLSNKYINKSSKKKSLRKSWEKKSRKHRKFRDFLTY